MAKKDVERVDDGYILWTNSRITPLEPHLIPSRLFDGLRLQQSFVVQSDWRTGEVEFYCGDLSDRGERCSCPYFKNCGKRCKHLWARVAYLSWGSYALVEVSTGALSVQMSNTSKRKAPRRRAKNLKATDKDISDDEFGFMESYDGMSRYDLARSGVLFSDTEEDETGERQTRELSPPEPIMRRLVDRGDGDIKPDTDQITSDGPSLDRGNEIRPPVSAVEAPEVELCHRTAAEPTPLPPRKQLPTPLSTLSRGVGRPPNPKPIRGDDSYQKEKAAATTVRKRPAPKGVDKPSGAINSGNNCYFLAILHVLDVVPGFRSDIESIYNSSSLGEYLKDFYDIVQARGEYLQSAWLATVLNGTF